MSFYTTPFTFDFEISRIYIDNGASELIVDDIYTGCKIAQATSEGILYGQIAAGSGKNLLGTGVQVGLTVELLGSWQLEFPSGNYVARISGGNLIGGPGGDPIAYTAGVQALLIQSAASTIVTSGGATSTLVPPLYTQGVDYSRPVGTVVSDPANTQLSFKTSLVESSADFWKDALILFVSGILKHQTKKVSAFDPTTDFLSVSAPFTSTPGVSDQFVLITF
jgi:hypothetical protein